MFVLRAEIVTIFEPKLKTTLSISIKKTEYSPRYAFLNFIIFTHGKVVSGGRVSLVPETVYTAP